MSPFEFLKKPLIFRILVDPPATMHQNDRPGLIEQHIGRRHGNPECLSYVIILVICRREHEGLRVSLHIINHIVEAIGKPDRNDPKSRGAFRSIELPKGGKFFPAYRTPGGPKHEQRRLPLEGILTDGLAAQSREVKSGRRSSRHLRGGVRKIPLSENP